MSDLQVLAWEAAVWCSMQLARKATPEALTFFGAEKGSELMLDGVHKTSFSFEARETMRTAVVNGLVARRRHALVRNATAEVGRILIFELETSFYDGVAQAASGNYFDEADLPPCDTWLWYEERSAGNQGRLYSWVPEVFFDVVEAAVCSHMCEGYRWSGQPFTPV
jgi:hypothetical protein